MRKCHPGQSVAVFYSADVYWHERILLWKGQGDCWYIMTPDGDVYLEDLSLKGEDGPVKMRVIGKRFDYWSSLRPCSGVQVERSLGGRAAEAAYPRSSKGAGGWIARTWCLETFGNSKERQI